MNRLLKAASYLFHPLWMPFAGSFLYFAVTPRFYPPDLIKAKLMALAIMTLFIPIVFFFLLRTLGKASSYFLEEVGERKWPLLFSVAVNLMVLEFILNRFDYSELYFFFLAILVSTLLAAVFAVFRIKISLHMMGLGGVTAFLVSLSFYFNLNLSPGIALLIALTGLTATSRLHFKAHSYTELLLGLLIGIIPQLITLKIWLQ